MAGVTWIDRDVRLEEGRPAALRRSSAGSDSSEVSMVPVVQLFTGLPQRAALLPGHKTEAEQEMQLRLEGGASSPSDKAV